MTHTSDDDEVDTIAVAPTNRRLVLVDTREIEQATGAKTPGAPANSSPSVAKRTRSANAAKNGASSLPDSSPPLDRYTDNARRPLTSSSQGARFDRAKLKLCKRWKMDMHQLDRTFKTTSRDFFIKLEKVVSDSGYDHSSFIPALREAQEARIKSIQSPTLVGPWLPTDVAQAVLALEGREKSKKRRLQDVEEVSTSLLDKTYD